MCFLYIWELLVYLQQVHIPRRNMCMRWNKVSPEGEFTATEKSSSKTSYITMTQMLMTGQMQIEQLATWTLCMRL